MRNQIISKRFLNRTFLNRTMERMLRKSLELVSAMDIWLFIKEPV
jgi:hypothetical protein